VSQARKSLVLLGAMAAASAGMGLYAWYGVRQPEVKEAERKAADERLVPGIQGTGADAKLARITVEAKGARTTLERGEAGWRVTAPVQAPADASVVESVAGRLATGKFDEVVEEAPQEADLERYGLKTPRFTVRARMESGREVVLYGGLENPFNGAVYMRREGDGRVFLAEGSVRWALERDTLELRDKELLGGLEEPKLKALEVKGKAHRYRVERAEGEEKGWQVVQPKAFPAKASAVAGLLSSLKSSARAQAFPEDSAEARKALGLAAPLLEATLTPKEGAPVRLLVGQSQKDGATRTHLLREEAGQATLAEVDAGVLAALDKPSGTLRDLTLLRFPREQVAELVVTPGGGKEAFSVRRASGAPAADGGAAEEAWQVAAGPRTSPAQRYKVSSLLYLLSNLEAAALVEEAPKSLARYGFEKGGRAVAFRDAAGKELARLELGGPVKGEAGRLYARNGAGAVFELEASRLDELPASADALAEAPAPAAPAPAAPAPGADGGVVATPTP
jgi:hypothetical protein